jgi:hypothetical protein
MLSMLAYSGWDRELRKALNDLLPEAQLHVPGEEFAPALPVLQTVSQRVVGE